MHLNASRSATRLKSIFISLLGANDANNLKYFNHFWSPMAGYYDARKETEIQVHIGSKMYAEMLIRSTAEAFSQLTTCLGINGSPFHSLDISPG